MNDQADTPLGLAEIHGPPSSARAKAPPMWRTVVSVPQFRLDRVQTLPAVQEDRIHPIRTLLLGERETTGAGAAWRMPRLVSLHVIMGADGRKFFSSNERLDLEVARLGGRLGPSATITAYTPAEMGGPPRPARSRVKTVRPGKSTRGFHHIVAAPILDSETWPSESGKISVPPLRLVEGAIELIVLRNELSNFLPFSKIADETFNPASTARWVRMRLTADGIELRAEAPFPGVRQAQMANLLAVPGADGGIVFRLLPDQQGVAWETAWRDVTPGDDAEEERLGGFKIDARRNSVPALEWRPKVDSKVAALPAEVFIPGGDLGMRIVSPGRDHTVAAVAELTPTYYRLAETRAPGRTALLDAGDCLLLSADLARPALALAATEGAPEAALTPPADSALEAGMRLTSAAGAEVAAWLVAANGASEVDHACSYDDALLAARLREAQGASDPRGERSGATAAAGPQTTFQGPPLSGYLPLDEGWLQFPIENVPAPDPNTDSDLVSLPITTPPNVLSGFVRFAQAGNVPPLLSAADGTTVALTEAPWSLSVLGAEAARLEVALKVGNAGGPLVAAAVHLAQPRLSSRGLLWLSSNRPNAREAIPRLSAGPTAFLDLPLDSKSARPDGLLIRLNAFEVHWDPATGVVERRALGLAIAPGARSPRPDDWPRLEMAGQPVAPVLWARHPQMPLAATMPMTRSARSSVYPLESRDLVPFLIAPKAGWFRLIWLGDKAFPKIDGGDGKALDLTPHSKWPWTKWKLPQGTSPRLDGIDLIAFGAPGWELSFDGIGGTDVWSSLRTSLRFDIPGQDEAFATATTPPVPGEAPIPVTIATSLDWSGLTAHWCEVGRRAAIARVVDSVADGMTGDALLVTGANAPDATVTTLIGQATWKTKLGFARADGSEPLPYGTGLIGAQSYTGDAALRGLTGAIRIQRTGGSAANYDIVGFSPVMQAEGDWLVDMQRVGRQALRRLGNLHWRPIRSHAEAPQPIVGLATLDEPLKVSWYVEGDYSFRFWFKDLGFDKNGNAVVPGAFANFEAWQATSLPLGACEWRLYPADLDEQRERFEVGEERIALLGLQLEPLRLMSVTAQMVGGEPQSLREITVRCRVYAGQTSRAALHEDNVIDLVLTYDGSWQATIRQTPLRFFAPGAAGEADLTLDTTVMFTRTAGLTFGPSFVEVMTSAMRLRAAVTVAADVQMITISYGNANFFPPPDAVSQIRLVWLKATLTKDDPPDLSFGRLLTVAAGPVTGEAGAGALAVYLRGQTVVRATLLERKITFTDAPVLEEFDEALGLSLKGNLPGVLNNRLPGTISLGLVASIGAVRAGRGEAFAALAVGRLDGVFHSAPDAADEGHGLALAQMRLTAASANGASLSGPGAGPAPWSGQLELFGQIAVVNAIAWPQLMPPAALDAAIPVPDGRTGRTRILVDQTSENPPLRHAVRYTLDAHTMDLGLAARMVAGDPNAIWTAAIVGEHQLGQGDARRAFTGAETIAIGAASAIVPPLNAADALSFAGRYRDRIRADGIEDTSNAAPGMVKTGIGRVATLFRGSLGLPFRAAFHQAPEAGLFLAGGVAGFAEPKTGDRDLVRMPVLAGLEANTRYRNGYIAQGGVAEIQVAWSDGHAQLPLLASGRTATTPGSWSGPALVAALKAGSVTRWSEFAGKAPPTMAVLVEQTFEASPIGSDTLVRGNLTATPFFIGAAIGIDRFRKVSAADAARFVSLLAAPQIIVDPANAGRSRTALLAAAIRIAAKTIAGTTPPPRYGSLLMTVGTKCSQTLWANSASVAAEDIALEAIRRPAFAAQAEPRAALLRLERENGPPEYLAVAVPRRRSRARVLATGEITLADAARGIPLGVGKSAGWMRGIEETMARPVRDDGNGTTASGVAGLTRTARFPAEARRSERSFDPTWHVCTRAPVYHSLNLESLASAPIPWLRPVPVRPRVPTRDALEMVWLDSKLEEVQSIIPENASLTSAGDRAGILTARAVHLETAAAPDELEFDPFDDRYGQPGQAGPVSPTIDRSPRPGPIPPNDQTPARRRRPCASPLFYSAPLTLVRGSADVMRGAEFGGWSATIVAAPGWDAIVTDSWDGTIDLAVEIDVAASRDAAPRIDPVALLGQLLGSTPPDGDKARARLEIGGASLEYARAVLRPWDSVPLSLGPDAAPIVAPAAARGFRQTFSLLLDPSPSGERSAAIEAVGKAMAASEGLPSVALKLSLRPPNPCGDPRAAIAEGLHGLATGSDVLSGARGGVPTTLHFDLFALRRGRGGLPLVPASVIFADQAYDDGLASVPLVAAVPATAEAGSELPKERGELRLVLAAERSKAELEGSLAVMLDLAFERRLELSATSPADGDLEQIGAVRLPVELQVEPASGAPRRIYVGTPILDKGAAYSPPSQPQLQLGFIHEFDLSRLVEANGRKAELAAGDMLVIAIGPLPAQTTELPSLSVPDGSIALTRLQTSKANSLRIQLTDRPVVEPPPSTYAAMMRRRLSETGLYQLALPLYALSPLPRRVAIVDPAAGFRTGLIRRAATFVWTLMRPRMELEAGGGLLLHVVKEERSGQSHRPDTIDEMVAPRSLGKVLAAPPPAAE